MGLFSDEIKVHSMRKARGLWSDLDVVRDVYDNMTNPGGVGYRDFSLTVEAVRGDTRDKTAMLIRSIEMDFEDRGVIDARSGSAKLVVKSVLDTHYRFVDDEPEIDTSQMIKMPF